jgi:hypothetical protein
LYKSLSRDILLLVFVFFSCYWCLWIYYQHFIVSQAVEVIDHKVDLLL